MKALRTLLVIVWLSASGLFAGTPARSTGDPSDPKELLNRFDAANALFEKGNVREAAANYTLLLKESLTPPTWGKVTFNLGMAQMRLSEYDSAIRTFESIFPSKVDDTEPGGNIMEEFRNYRFRASLLIARCFEAKGDISSTLNIVIKARDQHLYQAHCGNCAADAAETVRVRIDELQKKQPIPPTHG